MNQKLASANESIQKRYQYSHLTPTQKQRNKRATEKDVKEMGRNTGLPEADGTELVRYHNTVTGEVREALPDDNMELGENENTPK